MIIIRVGVTVSCFDFPSAASLQHSNISVFILLNILSHIIPIKAKLLL